MDRWEKCVAEMVLETDERTMENLMEGPHVFIEKTTSRRAADRP
jgi:hypothetical protein